LLPGILPILPLNVFKPFKKYLQGITYEIIVADNASTDDTVARLKKEAGVVVIENKANLGFGRANNIAAASAKGEYFLFLNSDMELVDNELKNMFEYIKSPP